MFWFDVLESVPSLRVSAWLVIFPCSYPFWIFSGGALQEHKWKMSSGSGNDLWNCQHWLLTAKPETLYNWTHDDVALFWLHKVRITAINTKSSELNNIYGPLFKLPPFIHNKCLPLFFFWMSWCLVLVWPSVLSGWWCIMFFLIL